jgi:protein phosphatase PTC7
MVVIECDGTKIKAANVGDSGFRIVRDGKVVFASPAQEHYFNCPYQLGFPPLSEDTDTASDAEMFDVAVKPGDLVIAGSDGLFDNVFDDEIAEVATAAVMSVRGAGALSAARAASEALAAVARRHAEDPLFESPFAVEAAAEKAGGAGKAKQSGPMGRVVTPGCQISYMDHHTGRHQIECVF